MLGKIGDWIANAYYWCLWYWGFADTDGNLNTHFDREKITFMLRRMKERQGLVWWVESLGTLYFLVIYVVIDIVRGQWGWMMLPLLLLAILTWLFVHVLYAYQPPDVRFWEGEGNP